MLERVAGELDARKEADGFGVVEGLISGMAVEARVIMTVWRKREQGMSAGTCAKAGVQGGYTRIQAEGQFCSLQDRNRRSHIKRPRDDPATFHAADDHKVAASLRLKSSTLHQVATVSRAHESPKDDIPRRKL